VIIPSYGDCKHTAFCQFVIKRRLLLLCKGGASLLFRRRLVVYAILWHKRHTFYWITCYLADGSPIVALELRGFGLSWAPLRDRS